jgi:hypothetical protein
VDAAIQLDDKSNRVAGEVCDVWAQGDLSPEVKVARA